MIEIVSKRVTYQELKDGSYRNAYIPQDSKFPVTTYLTSGLRDALITCPDNNDDSKTSIYVFVDNGNKEIGRLYLYGTRFMGEDKVYEAQTGLGLEVIDEYRGESVGAELMLFLSSNKEYDYVLVAGISQMILPMYRKMKYHLFEIPQYYKVRHAKNLFGSKGFKGWLLLGGFTVERAIRDFSNYIKYKKIKKNFVIKKETIIPEWVTDMIIKDGHKYMEVHNREWFQWALGLNTHGNDIQSFYSVYDRMNNPKGFFMTKERIIEKHGSKDSHIRGTVIEWESCDKSILSEADINLLANQTFSKNVDVIFTLACESGTESQLKKMGYHERASFKIGVKDKKKQLKDVGDSSLWRLRYGYASMVFSQ